VRLPEFARTTTFRWTLMVTGAFVLCTLLLFGFVYWQTAVYMRSNIDGLIIAELHNLAADPPQRRLNEIRERLSNDQRRIRIGAVFDAQGRPIAGNLESLPPGLAPDIPTETDIVRIDGQNRESQKARLVAQMLPSGETLVIGRNMDEIEEVAEIVGRALALGLLPAFGLAVVFGIVLSLRALDRLSDVNRRIQRIVAGDLRERLPTRGGKDPFDQLAVGVNRMLGDIETLIHELAGVGDDIAHDLRTPLTRVRVRLERGREHAQTLEELRAVADQAIAGLDQSLTVITALLRIAEIEHSRRLERFSRVRLAPLLREVGDLYEPIAEDKHVTLRVEIPDMVGVGHVAHRAEVAGGIAVADRAADKDEATVLGDRDLLFEAVANLVDNAVKFTPDGGHVELGLLHRPGEIVIRVCDSGPGVTASEREMVTKRFYRSDKSRRGEGLGLGLSLVAAIVKLHGFRFTIADGPGCIVEIACPQER
jgi:signal transduction histidine kinase